MISQSRTRASFVSPPMYFFSRTPVRARLRLALSGFGLGLTHGNRRKLGRLVGRVILGLLVVQGSFPDRQARVAPFRIIPTPVNVVRRIERGQVVTYPVDSQGRIIKELSPTYSIVPPNGTKVPAERFVAEPA
jgi:hypothetical protein